MMWSAAGYADTVAFTKSLEEMTAIRERPLFSPSRRPVEVPAMPDVAEEVPMIAPLNAALIGVITSSEGDGLALIKMNGQNDVARLRIGETIEGWQLDKIESHAVTFTNGDQATTLTFPESKAEATGDGSGEQLPSSSDMPAPKPLLPQGIVNPQ